MYQIEDIKGAATGMSIKKIGEGSRIARLRNPQTRATSLVATSPPPKVVSRAMMRTGEVTCVCVPDEMMMSTAISFAGDAIPLSHLFGLRLTERCGSSDEHKVLAELACAAALTPAYQTGLMDHL